MPSFNIQLNGENICYKSGVPALNEIPSRLVGHQNQVTLFYNWKITRLYMNAVLIKKYICTVCTWGRVAACRALGLDYL